MKAGIYFPGFSHEACGGHTRIIKGLIWPIKFSSWDFVKGGFNTLDEFKLIRQNRK